jgi:hypothetical protein
MSAITTEDITPGGFTWAYELQWYCKYFHAFHFVFLVVIPIASCFAAFHIPMIRNTLLMAFCLYIIGVISITVGEWTEKIKLSTLKHPN